MDWTAALNGGILIFGGAVSGFILRGAWDRMRRRKHIRAMPPVFGERLAFPNRPLIPTKPATFCAGRAEHSRGHEIPENGRYVRFKPLNLK